MKILVTGGCGQLGLSLRKISAEYPDHIFVFTDMPEGDITDRRGIARLIASEKADAVINCAAYTAVEKAETDEVTARLVNAEGAGNVALASFENGIPMVHISTDYVFPGTGTLASQGNRRHRSCERLRAYEARRGEARGSVRMPGGGHTYGVAVFGIREQLREDDVAPGP